MRNNHPPVSQENAKAARAEVGIRGGLTIRLSMSMAFDALKRFVLTGVWIYAKSRREAYASPPIELISSNYRLKRGELGGIN